MVVASMGNSNLKASTIVVGMINESKSVYPFLYLAIMVLFGASMRVI